MIRVLIVEDQKMAQENMEAIIKSSPNYILSAIIFGEIPQVLKLILR